LLTERVDIFSPFRRRVARGVGSFAFVVVDISRFTHRREKETKPNQTKDVRPRGSTVRTRRGGDARGGDALVDRGLVGWVARVRASSNHVDEKECR
jgi:hypothetical protein